MIDHKNKETHMAKNVPGQMGFDGKIEPQPPPVVKKKVPRGPIPPKHRMFNLAPGNDAPLVLDPNQFSEEPPAKPLARENVTGRGYGPHIN